MSELWKNGPSFEDGSFKVSTDSVLLASFASPKGKNGIDIGCGSGIISLIMLCTNETLHMTGIDVNEDAAETASSNIQRNGLSSRYNVICGDIREHRMLFNSGSFDFAVCNPPYYPENSGKLSSDTEKALARGETLCTLEDICKAAAYLLQILNRTEETPGSSVQDRQSPKSCADRRQKRRQERYFCRSPSDSYK